MRLLVVEDEPDLARTLRKALQEEDFVVDVAHDGEDGLFNALEIPYDAVVLDLLLPHVDGWSLLTALRRAGRRTPVLVLTARDSIDDKVRALNLGADDYLTKPFALTELVARVRALIRRASGQPDPELLIGDVTVDTAARRVFRNGALVDVTAREYAILELLARRRGTLVSRATIQAHIYDDAADVLSNTIEVHVSSLRRKLGRDIIQTRRGEGYMVDA
jgi:two-component system OmpR family response regulator